MDWPQWIFLSCLIIQAASDIAICLGYKPEPSGEKTVAFRILFRPVFYGSLMVWGGFFPNPF